MLYFSSGASPISIPYSSLQQYIITTLEKIGRKNKILLIPPDYSRYDSQAGRISEIIWEYYGEAVTDILPSLGTHFPMTKSEITKMFGKIPASLFREHNWRSDIVDLGIIPDNFIKQISNNKLDYSIPVQVNKLFAQGAHDQIFSIGQIVPHEVVGMANHNKNIFVGIGGAENINKSHFLGAVCGIENLLGEIKTPVRDVFNYASDHFMKKFPIIYILTVIRLIEGKQEICGLFIGDDAECYEKAAALSQKVNITILDKPLEKIIVHLNSEKFKSCWLGNKAIYRTRKAIKDKGELIILAPGLKEFGEDKIIDSLIRKYGYKTTPEILDLLNSNTDLQNNLSAAAHLIHGSSENRFKITYCPGFLTKEEIHKVNFNYGELKEYTKIYNPSELKEGFNKLPNGEEIFFISNPGAGLWMTK